MALPLKLSSELSEIVAAYTNGLSLRQIAKLHDCSTGTVRNVLTRAGVVMRPKGRAPKAVKAEVTE